MPDSRHVTLVASTVNTVVLDADYANIEVVNVTGTASVYFTVNGATPTVKGTGTVVLPAAIGGVTMPGYSGSGTATTVRLISAGTPDIAVRGW